MKTAYLVLIIALTIVSCSSNNDSEMDNEPDNFYAFEVGNSWVYKYYTKNHDTNEFTNYVGISDSVSIISTEIIRENIFYKFRWLRTNSENYSSPYLGGEGEGFYFRRDSIGYLVDDIGNIHYWNNNWQERYWHSASDPTYAVFAKLNENIITVNIEAGNFNCLDLEIYMKNIETGEQNPPASHFYYAKGIGNVYDKFGYLVGNATAYEKRLDSYNFE